MNTILNAATATGVGRAAISPHLDTEVKAFSLVITGAPTQVTLGIEGSLDNGVTFNELLEHDATAEGSLFHLSGKPMTHYRANLKTLTGGTAPTVTVNMGS